jgi:fluoride ion exporter CrcB/FEX
MLKRAYRRVSVALGTGILAALALVPNAFATADYQFDSVVTPITEQVQEAFTVILPVAGGLIALFIGWRVLKRLARA